MTFYLEREIHAPVDTIRKIMRSGIEGNGYVPLLRSPQDQDPVPDTWQSSEYTVFNEYNRTFSRVLEDCVEQAFPVSESGYLFCVTGVTERKGIKIVDFRNIAFLEFKYDLMGGWPAGLFLRQCMRKECWKDRCNRILDNWKTKAEASYVSG